MNNVDDYRRYYARLTDQDGVFEYIVRIGTSGCFVTDEANDWEKDEDYKDEAMSNEHIYTELTYDEAHSALKKWNREL